MKVALDTNRYRDFFDGNPEAVEIVRHAETVVILLPVLAELRCGFEFGSRRRENESTLTRFLSEFAVLVLSPDEVTTSFYSHLYLQLRRQGTPIPTHDLWIAALVEQHRLVLYSRDHHFDHLPQLARI